MSSSDQLNRLIANSSSDCMLVMAADGRIQQVGESTQRLLELAAPSQLNGVNWLSIWEAPERATVRDAIIGARQGKEVRFSVFGYTLKRTPKWWDIVVSLMDSVDDSPKMLLAVVRDVTELHLREQQIRELNAQLEQRVEQRTQDLIRANYQLHNALLQVRDLYDHAPCGYLSLDRQGCFVEGNQTTWRWLGLTQSQAIAENRKLAFNALLSEPDAERFDALYRWVLAGQKTEEEAFDIRRKDGSFFTALINATPVLDFEGRFVNCRMSMVDITARRLAETKLQRLNSDLETANAELETFSYTVSHDLRAPLRHIHHYIEMGRDAATGPEGAQAVTPFLNHVLGSISHMGKLIDGLLDLAHVGRTALREMDVPMGELVNELILAQQRQRKEDGQAAPEVEWVVASDWPVVPCDPVLVRQVWNNLISNALKYSRKRSAVRIAIGTRPRDDGLAEFFVADNGVGFDAKFKGKLFGMFQRLHSESEFEGTGIGLALTRKIVERHGGSIWAEAEKNVGCTISFSLPLASRSS